jgi:organic radical activating enzyme
VETNGTQQAPTSLDWICVSPKAGTPLVVTQGSELKLVYPQPDLDPASLVSLKFDHWWLQPMDGPNRHVNTAAAVDYCLAHPLWRLSLQTHKFIGIP